MPKVASWKHLRKALKANGISIGSRGSEAKLTKVLPDGTFLMYVLQHECCRSPSATVRADHLAAIKRRFSLTDEELGL